MATDPLSQLDGIADRLIRNVPFFKGLNKNEVFGFLAKAGRAAYKPGGAVFREGDAGDDALHIVVTGKVEVSKRMNDGSEEIVDTLGVGHCFGEMALVDSQPRSATVIAREPTVCLTCTGKALASFESVALKFYENLARIVADRHLQIERQFKKLMKPICVDTCIKPLTKDMPTEMPLIDAAVLGRLGGVGQPYSVAAGTVVIKENALGQYMYLVVEGVLEVRKNTPYDYSVLATLTAGNYFGETALVSLDDGRSADVVAVSDTQLVRVNLGHLQKAPEVGALVYRELAKIFSVRLRRSTTIYMHTYGRGCHKGCELLGMLGG